LLAAVLLLAGVGASHAVVRIADDRGGRIGTYVDKYQDLRTSGEAVIIDGLCASACTIVLGAVPYDKICVTSHANLGFHAAWDFGDNGRAVTNPDAIAIVRLDLAASRIIKHHDVVTRDEIKTMQAADYPKQRGARWTCRRTPLSSAPLDVCTSRRATVT